MKYLLFDYAAISIYVQTSNLQSYEFNEGKNDWLGELDILMDL